MRKWRYYLRDLGQRKPKFGVYDRFSAPGYNVYFGWWFLAIRKNSVFRKNDSFLDLGMGRGLRARANIIRKQNKEWKLIHDR